MEESDEELDSGLGDCHRNEKSSLNLNTCIDEILEVKEKKWRRRRLSKSENEFLEKEYQKDPNWDVAKKKWLSAKLGLGRTKIYKWNYDRRKRDTNL